MTREEKDAARFLSAVMDGVRERNRQHYRRMREVERLLEQARDVAARLEEEISFCPHPTHWRANA